MHHNGYVNHLIHEQRLEYLNSLLDLLDDRHRLCVITERLLSTVGDLFSVAQLGFSSVRR